MNGLCCAGLFVQDDADNCGKMNTHYEGASSEDKEDFTELEKVKAELKEVKRDLKQLKSKLMMADSKTKGKPPAKKNQASKYDQVLSFHKKDGAS